MSSREPEHTSALASSLGASWNGCEQRDDGITQTSKSTYSGGRFSSGRGLWGRRRGLNSLNLLGGSSSSGLDSRHYCRCARDELVTNNESDMGQQRLQEGKRERRETRYNVENGYEHEKGISGLEIEE
jgi:hypothetical protein